MTVSGATATVTREAFTPGTAPVAGYEGQFFLRSNITGADDNYRIETKIEDVRTLAGQTATASFWVKTNANKNLSVYFIQNFGSGGSSAVTVTPQTIAATTSWTRVSATFSIPSVSGKTIGTSSFLQFVITNPANETFTMDVWGVQVESGSVATAFQTATGTIQGELAACQRYYQRYNAVATYGFIPFTGYAGSSTSIIFQTVAPVTMRTTASSIDFGGAWQTIGTANLGISTFTSACENNHRLAVSAAVTGATAGGFFNLLSNNNATSYLGFSAEL
jgi:hypothetical protein